MDKGLKIAIMLSAVDKATGIMNKVFSNAEKQAKSLQKTADTFNKIGDKSLIAGTAVTAFFGKTISDSRDSKIAQDKLIQGFITMGSTAAQAQKMIDTAGSLQFRLGSSDEDIMDVMGKLSTFKRAMTDQSIANGVFMRTTQAAFDMQAKGYGDAMGNIAALGAAMQNPALGAQALMRSKAINKEDLPIVRAIQQAKGVAAAQKFLLGAIEKQVKGTAEATADPLKVMQLQFGEVSEAIGRKLLPIVNKYAGLITANIDTIFKWIDSHGDLIKKVAAGGVALLAFGGAMKVVGFTISAFGTAMTAAGGVIKTGQFIAGLAGVGSKALEAGENISKFQKAGLQTFSALKSAGAFLLDNPYILIAAAIAAAGYLIYKNWDKVTAAFAPLGDFFAKVWDVVKNVFVGATKLIAALLITFTPVGLIYHNWDKVKAFFSALWNAVKGIFSFFVKWAVKLFLNFTPLGLIIKHWKPIAGMFGKVWDGVKDVFSGVYNWVANLGIKFFDAGKNIVKSIYNGIKSIANMPVDAIANMTKKMRDYLPFSPAKAGAFRDLHRVKIVETLVSNMNPRPAMKAMNQLTGSMFNQAQLAPVPARSGGGNNFNFSVNVHLSGKATKEDAQMVAREARQEFDRMMRDYQANKSRVSF